MDNINSYCVICGTGYHCCISCPENRSSSWRLITDTENHFKVYMILCDYRDKKITKEVALKQLNNVDITGWENFKEGTKQLIAEILTNDTTDEVEEIKENNKVKEVKKHKTNVKL